MYPGRVLVTVGPPRISMMPSQPVIWSIMRLVFCGLDGRDPDPDFSSIPLSFEPILIGRRDVVMNAHEIAR